MGKPKEFQRGYRTMLPEEILNLSEAECLKGIRSCRTAHFTAKKYDDQDRMDTMELQIGAFTIQIDMLRSGDIKEVMINGN